VLQCLPGSGETIGAALCADTRVRGVIFTGSLAVAQQINRALAARGDEVVLIAETGGQNAMIVDSSALPEQVVSDVLSSAFDSAGQRCSALRVLYLQQEVADQVLRLLRGAMAQLQVGNPAQLDCDIGPLIDAEARNAVWAHIEALRPLARSCYALTLGDSASAGHFVAPTLLEIASLQSLPQEVFGPVLHVLRFGADELDQVLDQINQSGYGLTHGIHSRIGSSIARVMARIQAGNIYVNRNMIGAVVGVQPFGGSRMSGTGPKAGGPFYLYRLTRGAWRALDGEARQAPALPGLDALAALVPSLNLGQACQERLLNGIARAREASPLRQSLRLPGPAGESNSLGFAARGAVGCMAPDLEQTLWQMIAALACGNRVLLPQAGAVGFLAEALSDWVECVLDLPQAEALQVLLFSGAAGQADALRRVLAARPGALLPLITSEAGAYEMQRLVVERALSINSAALGGNAGLMCLDA
jgi:RHH-type proline utilization regulon transcriptional repressor/proline dehydrogenase/delta 1-pyrroline-5-carboxylate dehydrogenase